jgi:ferritin-like metal-binding protein YciE
MAVKSLQDMFVEELRDIYHAEKQLVKALPKMARAASSTKLAEAFEKHLEETKGQVERLEQIFDELDLRTRGKTCEAMQGLVEEAQDMMDEIKQADVRDAALIIAAQKVEHYEIASYGSLRSIARTLGYGKPAELLEQTLREEEKTDAALNKLALDEINQRALQQTA